MKLSRPTLLAGAALALLAGCATGPLFKALEAAPDNLGQVYIYRPFVLSGAIPHRISIDGSDARLSLPNGSWRRIVLPPGPHTLRVTKPITDERCGALGLQLKPGETIYMLDRVNVIVLGANRVVLTCSLSGQTREDALQGMANLFGAE